MKSSGVGKGSIAAVLLVATLVLAGLIALLVPSAKIDAMLAEESDAFGYIWQDNKDPDPKVEYNWIDAKTNGNEIMEITTTSGMTSVTNRSLPFTFSYYGMDYDTIWITARGYLTFNQITTTSTSYGSNLPNGDGHDTIVAVIWNSFFNYYTAGGTYGGIHYYEDPAGDFVCIEWNRNSGTQTAEIILYKSGLIKMQWKELGTSYPTGLYTVVGIENEDGSDGQCYSLYSNEGLQAGLALEFSTEIASIEALELFDGDGDDGHICYAEHRTYEFRTSVSSGEGWSDIVHVKVLFGPVSQGLGAEFRIVGGLPDFNLLPGSGQYMDLESIDVSANPDNLDQVNVSVNIMFLFPIPLNGNISVSVWARGRYALPMMHTFEDVLYLENMAVIAGDFEIIGNRDRAIKPGEYTMENESVTFTGLMLQYEHHTEGIYPPNSSFTFMMRDELNELFIDVNSSGRAFNFNINMPMEAIRKVFTFILEGIPLSNVNGTLPEAALNVDNTPPSAPTTMTIRADSWSDTQTLVDNDDVLYVTWSTASDIGSGVARYRIYTSYVTDDDSIPSTDAKTTRFIWEGTTVGEFTLLVWAEDEVGHAGTPIRRTIIIDKDPPVFSEFNILPNQWIKTLTPDCRIIAKDAITEGVTMVSGESVEYSISTAGLENFQEWISADVLEDALEMNIQVKPQFEEGIDNWLRFRAKDIAGNGFVQSENFRVWIDVTPVVIRDVFPTQNVWHDLKVIETREIEAFLFDETSGVDTGNIYYRVSTSKDEEGAPIWDTGIAQEGNWIKYNVRPADRLDGDNLVRVHFKFTGFKEGPDNTIQFRMNDRAGNGRTDGWTLSTLYSVWINTRPVAMIRSPVDNQQFMIDELFTLDGSDSYDIDQDRNNLKFEWYEGTRLLGTGMILDNVRLSILGFHVITLYVSDPVHRLDEETGEDSRTNTTVRIEIIQTVFSKDVDSDGDGMDDYWEDFYGLDPFDPSDAHLDYDMDGFTNLQEYRGSDGLGPWREGTTSTNPRDPLDYPRNFEQVKGDPIDPPFSLIIFLIVIVVAVLIAALIVVVGYIRMNSTQDREKREEAEEEAMLVTPQLDIPTMPVMPMIDTSVPTLPAPAEGEEKEALPPAPEEGATVPSEEAPQPIPMAMEGEVPMEAAPPAP